MKKNIFVWIGVLYVALTGTTGCNNIFTDMSNQTSDQAKMDDATNLINAGLYNDAILKLQTISTPGQTATDVQILFASAYAGRGGLDLINLANTLSGSGNPPTLFLTLLKAFTGSTAQDFADQITAESYIMAISPTGAGRTGDENMFIMFVELAKLGTLFAFTADPLGHGSIDAGYAVCQTTAAQADQVVTALGIIVDSATALGNNALSGSLTPIVSQCSNFSGMCNITQTSNVTAPMEFVAATLVGETNLNIGLQVPQAPDDCEISGGTGGDCQGVLPSPLCTSLPP